jgi:hypothetical protein
MRRCCRPDGGEFAASDRVDVVQHALPEPTGFVSPARENQRLLLARFLDALVDPSRGAMPADDALYWPESDVGRVQRLALQVTGWSGRHPRGRCETRRIRVARLV